MDMLKANQTIPLERAIELARSGKKAIARQLLAKIVQTEPNNEMAWMWLAYCAKSPSERRRYLERVLEINPVNFKAQEALEELEPITAEKTSSGTAKTILALGTACGVIGLLIYPGLLGLIALICGIAASVMGEKKGRAVALLGILDMVFQFVLLRNLTGISYLF